MKNSLTIGWRMALACIAAALVMGALAPRALAQKSIDPNHAFAWDENCGWQNWGWGTGDAPGRVRVWSTCLTGWVWCENTGWMSLSADLGPVSPQGHHFENTDNTNYGVNINAGGHLSGFAWNENTGWTNFGGGAMANPPNPARYDRTFRRFRGYIWNENTGWTNLDHALAYVGTLCPADFDNNGQLQTADIFAFLNAWFSASPSADFNGDGVANTTDIFNFLTAWFNGC